ncbi:MAG: UDP-glucose--hexose-1-phosphate uridylyltransferase [Anaerolineales bacterium]|jgi:UDPglucose--hexose-1-phosphate uridylyltransferase|nr:UDP-glucose--hexose-1-phosphate uridylyltransferase [Anaerolineales bacterium]
MYDSPHRRYNPLTREWILVSPHRAKRPWQGQVEKTAPSYLPEYDPTCYLCPGNERAGGIHNPQYTGTFVFENDFAALLPEDVSGLRGQGSGGRSQGSGETSLPDQPLTPDTSTPDTLFQALPESGVCKVICFSPRHDLSLPQLTLDAAEAVINTWSDETAKLFKRPEIRHVQVFENKGAVMGCSNPHPHSQIWSQSQIPTEPAKELASQRDYFSANKRPLLLDYLAEEHKRGERILASNQHFTALVPFWAVWPFEVLVIAQRAAPSLPALSQPERRALADIYQKVTIRYDNLFEISFPYSMGFHQAPNDGESHPEWVLHAHFYPPLLRSATVRKFMVGYEMLGMPQRDITPETAAQRLRELPEVHYRNAG